MTIKRIFLAAFCMLAVSLANAQTATIKGFVYAAENGEPVPFASVFLKEQPLHHLQTLTVIIPW